MRITRRRFLADSALCASGVQLVPLAVAELAGAHSVKEAKPGSLEEQFRSPADAAWPWVYWWGNDGNLSREAITTDLEAMHAVGIRGALYMEVDQYLPKGPVRFLTPEWRELMQHAMREATRLGITLNISNAGGWAGAGGPWITPELSMQVVVWSESAVDGPKAVKTVLAQPKTVHGYYRDIAVLAFPTPAGDRRRMVDCAPHLTYGLERKPMDASKLLDGNPGTVTVLPLDPESESQYLNIDFSEPFTARAASIALDAWNSGMTLVSGAIQVSEDGNHYRTIREMELYWPRCSVNFDQVSSRHYRILIKPGLDDWFFAELYRHGIPLGGVDLHQGPRIEDIPGKASYLRQDAYSTREDVLHGNPEFTADTLVPYKQILDISNKMTPDGLLQWDVPSGRWTVLRFGYTSTGKVNHPAPKESQGLECDKLNKKAVEVQFEGLIGKLLQDEAAAGASSLRMTHVDSWEAGCQNWTHDFRKQFQGMRGYDPLPYLPVLTGRAVETAQQSERFLWDLRRTVADSLLENFADHLKELSHKHGLTLSIEAYGTGPFDEVAYGGRADVPMGEFWIGHDEDIFNGSTKEMASSAHVYGRPIVAAESFTATPESGKWQNHPFSLKPLGDLAFTWGINRFVFNFFTMQSWPNRKPGMTTGPWGVHYDRTNTWWQQSGDWHTYLARCQTLLQSGSFVADVAYLGTENTPSSALPRERLDTFLPPGYDYDVVPAEIILKDTTVQNGRLVLGSGMSYRLLVLPQGYALTPQLLRQLRDLVKEGANIVGPRPLRSPSLENYPQCDEEVRRVAEELWGDCDGSSIKENSFGAGKVFWGEALVDVLGNLKVPPDFACYEGAVGPPDFPFDQSAVGQKIRFIHRRIDGDDFYFVASAVPEAKRFLCTFRVTGDGRRPELWWPDSGRVEPVSLFHRVGASRTVIPLRLDPYGSVFVVFRKDAKSTKNPIVSVQRNGAGVFSLTPMVQHRFSTSDLIQTDSGFVLETADEGKYSFVTRDGSLKAEIPRLPAPLPIHGPWDLKFPRGLGAPEHVTLNRLISWTQHSDPGVRYFSGTATYRNQFRIPEGMRRSDRRLYLDLGQVCVIAEVFLNGHKLGVLWKPPFLVDVTEVVAANTNNLEIRVVNLWPNRLIGDEQLPEDCDWATPSTLRDPVPADWGLALDRWPRWLIEDQPSPTGRVTFTTWKHWRKDAPLLTSGLLGPVQIVTKARARLTR